jgi:hypothetical protein
MDAIVNAANPSLLGRARIPDRDDYVSWDLDRHLSYEALATMIAREVLAAFRAQSGA